MGIIALEGLSFFAHHGYYPQEREVGNRFRVDVYLQTDFNDAAQSDDLEGTINYEGVYKLVKHVMEGGGKQYLLERLAQRIIDASAAKYPHMKWMRVRISKLNPPIAGDIERVYVELEKTF
jgi:dihydroneopterin aldolase